MAYITKPYSVVRIGRRYSAVSRHTSLLEAAKAVVSVRSCAFATIIRDGITGKRITQRAAESIAKAGAA